MNNSKVLMIIKNRLTIWRKRTSLVGSKKACPSVEKLEITEEIIETLNFKNGEELSKLFLKSDVILLPEVFKFFLKYQLINLTLILCIVWVYLAILGCVVWNILIWDYKHFKMKN